MLERRRNESDFWGAAVGVGGLSVLEKRLWERFGIAPRNHSQTDNALDCDCVSTGEAAAKRSLESCAVRTPRPTKIGTNRVGLGTIERRPEKKRLERSRNSRSVAKAYAEAMRKTAKSRDSRKTKRDEKKLGEM